MALAGFQIEINGQQKVVNSVGEIRKILKEAQFEALRLSAEFGETSAEALQAAKTIAQLKDQIKDASERVDLFDPGNKFKVFGNAVQTAAGSIAALQGAMGLFGAESEDVQKSLLKVQSALALSQGLSVIADGAKDFQRLGAFIQQSTIFIKANELATKAASITMKLFGVSIETTSVSFKVLKGAIAATGIGILVIALAEAVSYMQNFTSATEEAAKAQEELNKKLTEVAKSSLKAEQDFLDNKMKLDVARLKATGASEDEIFKVEQSYRRLKAKALQEYYNEVKNTDKEAAEDAKSELEKANTEGQVAEFQNQERLRKQREEAAKKKKEDDLQRFVEEQELEKKRQNDFYQIQLDAYEKRKKLREKENTEIVNSYLTLYEREKIARDEVEAKKKSDEELYLRFENSPLALRLNKEIEARAANLQNQRDTANASKEIAIAESNARIAAMDATQQAITNLALIAGRETVAGKALAVAASIINTYSAIAKTLNAFAGVPIPGYAIAQAIATGIAGLAAVKNIVSVQVPGAGGGGGNAPAAPSLGTSAPLAPPVTVAPNQVTLDQRSINSLGNQALRAYVVERDITGSQERTRRIQRQTSFG